MFGSFLWIDMLLNNDAYKGVIRNEKRILETVNPIICYTKGFDSGMLCDYQNKHGVGWLVEQRDIKMSQKKNVFGILCSGGLGNLSLEKFTLIVEKLRIHFCEIRLFASRKFMDIENCESFDFINGWDQIDVVIGRPGLGTISDCVEYSKPLIAIGEKNNIEIVQNAKNVESMGIGWDCVTKDFEVNKLEGLADFTFPSLHKTGFLEVESLICKTLVNAR